MREPEIIDAEFYVVGEPRWAPFKRWLLPKIEPTLIWLAQAAAFVALMAFSKFVLWPLVSGSVPT